MSRIELHDNPRDIILKLCDGNVGALNALMNMFAKAQEIDPEGLAGYGPLLMLDSFEIYGSRIWMLYKDVCKEDINKTIRLLRACQLGIIDRQKLNHAIDNRGDGIAIEDVSKALQERLPNYQFV